jgi:outer membrane protein OmpA-like peptidoglycan-associated protein
LWARSHVVVNGGILQLNASQDPAFANAWVTGGVAQSAVANTYGAYFVRSKMTGAGATQVEMLWPTSGWPPEIDFNETRGGDSSSIATLHYGSSNLQDYRSITIDMTQWHTWGVIWSPSSVTYTVDGRVWGAITVAAEIPTQPMTLDITQQTWCSWGFACPTSPESTEVDWVAEYKASSASSESVPTTAPVDTVAVSPFAPHSAILSVALKVKISRLANVIKANGDSKVRLVGYGDAVGSRSANVAVSRARALSVKSYLTLRLAALGVTGVSITMTIKATPEP